MPRDERTRRQCAERIMSQDYGDFIMAYYFSEVSDSMAEDYCAQDIDSRYSCLYVPKKEWEPLTYSGSLYFVIPKLYALQDTTSMSASGILQTHQSLLDLSGQGVLMGIIDTGIDYTNPLFRNPDGSTRILSIWDQTIEDGPLPPWMDYGAEYRSEDIDRALSSGDPLSVVPSTDTNGHGTFLAGIAAGGDRPEDNFVGAAPQASLAIVKLKPAKQYLRDFFAIRPDAVAYQENDIMLAVAYLRNLRSQFNMPLVILCGLGTNWGSHTGTTPLAEVLRRVTEEPASSVVLPVGNETGLAHHYEGHVQEEGAYEDVEIRVAAGETGFQLELWSQVPDRFTVSILSPGGDYVPQIPARLGQNQYLEFVLERSVVDISYRLLEAWSDNQLVVMRFLTPSPGIWTVRVYSVNHLSGIFHMWLPVREFIREDTVFLNPSPNTTLTVPSPLGNALSVAAYNHRSSSIYIRSGRGYTRLGGIKPDIAAPGVDVYGPGLNGRYIRQSGTSVAAAHAAGAAACLLEWGVVRGRAVWLNNSIIRAALIQGAERNPNLAYPNREWGYGTLDLYGALASLQ